jgi:hypothetical protein
MGLPWGVCPRLWCGARFSRQRLVERGRRGLGAELAEAYHPDLEVLQFLGRLLQLLGLLKGLQTRGHDGAHPISRLMTSASFWPAAGRNTGLVT